jgi:hypothetical protein
VKYARVTRLRMPGGYLIAGDATPADRPEQHLWLNGVDDPDAVLRIRVYGDLGAAAAAPGFPVGTVVSDEIYELPVAIDEPVDSATIAPAVFLARALGTRLAPHMPVEFLRLGITSSVLETIRHRLADLGEPLCESLPLAVEAALNELQDSIDEYLDLRWPAGSRRYDAWAELRESAIHAGFGDSTAPLLAIDPIPLAELEDPTR